MSGVIINHGARLVIRKTIATEDISEAADGVLASYLDTCQEDSAIHSSFCPEDCVEWVTQEYLSGGFTITDEMKQGAQELVDIINKMFENNESFDDFAVEWG